MLIDEKGRIFGKINIIDFIIFVILIILIPTMITSCFKITGEQRKTIVEKTKFDIQADERSKVRTEMRSDLDKLIAARQILEADKIDFRRYEEETKLLLKLQEIYTEGLRAGYADGYSDGKSEK